MLNAEGAALLRRPCTNRKLLGEIELQRQMRQAPAIQLDPGSTFTPCDRLPWRRRGFQAPRAKVGGLSNRHGSVSSANASRSMFPSDTFHRARSTADT